MTEAMVAVTYGGSVRYFWLRDEDRVPFGCLAVAPTEDPDLYVAAVSILHKGDAFNRRLARRIAAGRLVYGHRSFRVEVSEGEDVKLVALEGAAKLRWLPVFRALQIARVRRRELERRSARALGKYYASRVGSKYPAATGEPW